MLYTQFRENERTARYEVKLIPGNRCQLVVAAATTETVKARKTASKQEWVIGGRDDSSWVDLESELKRLADRAPIDLNLRSGEDGGAGGELLGRLDGLLDGLYRGDSAENYLTYLGLLNILEYFRIINQLKRAGNEATGARQIGIVSDEYFECRKLALELDIAELTEWLVAHDIGLPDLTVFYPSEYKSEETAAIAGPKKRGKKKDDAESGEGLDAPQSVIPESLHHVVELIRLHQADASHLLHFVDDVMHRGNFENLSDAITAIHRVVPWIDPEQFEAGYHSMKREQARETARQQAAILRQHEIVFNRPKRGKENGRRDRDRHPMHRRSMNDHADERDSSPLDEFAASIDEDPNAAYERAMDSAIGGEEGNAAPQLESGEAGEPTQPSMQPSQDEGTGENEMDPEGEPQFDFGGGQPMQSGPRPPQHHNNDRSDRGRRRRGRPGPPPRGGHQQGRGPGGPGGPRPHRGPRDHSGPRDQGPREQRGPRQGGSRQPNFDEIQPSSNYSPGLPPTGVPGAAKPGGKPANKWRKRR